MPFVYLMYFKKRCLMEKKGWSKEVSFNIFGEFNVLRVRFDLGQVIFEMSQLDSDEEPYQTVLTGNDEIRSLFREMHDLSEIQYCNRKDPAMIDNKLPIASKKQMDLISD